MEDVFITFQRMSLDEFDASGWFEAGVLLKKKGKYKEALICFEEVFKIDPYHPDLEDHIQTCRDKLYKDFEGW